MTPSGPAERLSIPDSLPPEPPLAGAPGYGSFERVDAVGRGGNATVYAATVGTEDERTVALKEPHVAADAADGAGPASTIVERFRTEAATWAGIADHDHVVTVHAWGTDPGPWIALEYMDDGNLVADIGSCGLDRGLWVGACVAAAVDHAHRNGVAHLDLKPENVLFRSTPGDAWSVPKVADWGMARLLRAETVNLEGLSPRYAAPEQFDPGRYGAVGAPTDVYQLGVVLYELLVGAPPFDGPPRILADAVRERTPPAPSGRNPALPTTVDDLLDRALAKDPADRYDSMQAFRRALESLLADRTDYDPDATSVPPPVAGTTDQPPSTEPTDPTAPTAPADPTVPADGTAPADSTDSPGRVGGSAAGDDSAPKTPATSAGTSTGGVGTGRAGTGEAGTGRAVAGVAGNPYERALTLADEGFVQLSDRYFARRDPAPPLEAWRRGVTLADARAGRAVEREVARDDLDLSGDPGRDTATGTDDEVDSGDEGEGLDEARVVLAERLLEEARAGVDHVVLGPPGSGKSTVCKQVACEWFDRGYGPVFYRESGTSDRFDRPDSFASHVSHADGHALVVVEDAVRSEANAVFAFVDRVAETDDVTVLLDAREGEWRDAGRGSRTLGPDPVTVARDALEPVYVPRPDAREHERFVASVEAATDRAIEIDLETLRTDIQEAATSDADTDETQPGELFYLLHRLTTLASDPLADDRAASTLTAAIAAVYDRLAAAGEDALRVGVCANLLNAAGLGVQPELLYAVAPDDPLAVDDAVDVLDGRVVFPRAADWSGGTTAYPAIHEAWSTEFLDYCLDATDETAARERFGAVLDRVLSLADDPGARDRVAGSLEGDAPYLARIDEAPTAWADDVVESVFGLAEAAPRLAPLFGTTDTAAYSLPDACSAARRRSVPLRRAHAHRERSDYARARAEYETALERARAAADRLRVAASHDGLGTTARLQNDHATAQDHHERALEIVCDLGDRRLEAEILNHLGMNATRRDDYEAGKRYVERSLAVAEERGDRLAVARCRHTLGTIAYRQGATDEAREHLERSLAIKRDLGDRAGIARSLNRLSGVFDLQADVERAREYAQRSYELWLELGNRWWEAALLHNLGIYARQVGAYDRAREYHERALEINRELDVPHGLVMNYNKLGRLAERADDYESAREYHERSLEIARDLGKPHDIARALQDLGSTARGLGDLDAAQDYLDRALERYRDVGDTVGRGDTLQKLGDVARDRGNHETARDRYEAALSCSDDIGNAAMALDVLAALIELERDADRPDRAREYCETARDRLADASFPDPTGIRDAIESSCAALDTENES